MKIECSKCGEKMPDAWPHVVDNGNVYCLDCGFRLRLVGEKDYLELHGIYTKLSRAAIDPSTGEIVRILSGRFPWEHTSRSLRRTEEYAAWRQKVFSRDHFTCVICGQVGGSLEAHHIKPFGKYEEMRTSLDNGVTLCKSCHKKVHKEKPNEWLHTD